jgi:hypothetical protein
VVTMAAVSLRWQQPGQPFWRWKKGSASAVALENYGKNTVSLFYRNEGIHKKTDARRLPRAKQAMVAQSAL